MKQQSGKKFIRGTYSPAPLDGQSLQRQADQRAKEAKLRAARRERQAEGLGSKGLGTPLLAGLGLLILLFLLSSVAWYLHHQPPDVSATALSSVTPGRTLQTREVVSGFLEAATHEERLTFIRHPQHAGEIMREFYAAGPGSRETVEGPSLMDYQPGLDQMLIDRPFTMEERYAVTMENAPPRLLCVVAEGGTYKVDFLTYARHCNPDWNRLNFVLREAPADVRVFVTPGDYYAAPYSDIALWQAWRATSPDLDHELTFYSRRGTQLSQQLENLIPKAAGPGRRVYLRVQPTPSKPRLYEISTLISQDWLEPAP